MTSYGFFVLTAVALSKISLVSTQTVFYEGSIVMTSIDSGFEETSNLGRGNYATFSPVQNIQGLVFYYNISQGCESPPVDQPAVTNLTSSIALTRRGDCQFWIKASNAQSRGHSALVVIDDDDNDGTIVMGLPDNNPFSFPSVSISLASGNAIINKLENPSVTDVSLSIQPAGQLTTPTSSSPQTTDSTSTTPSNDDDDDDGGAFDAAMYARTLIFVVVLVFVIGIILVYCHGGIRAYNARRRARRAQQRMQVRRQQEAVEENERQNQLTVTLATLPVLKMSPDLNPENDSYEDHICAVCLDECSKGDRLKELPCKHAFHITCIEPWLRTSQTCPLCKASIFPSEEDLELFETRNRIVGWVECTPEEIAELTLSDESAGNDGVEDIAGFGSVIAALEQQDVPDGGEGDDHTAITIEDVHDDDVNDESRDITPLNEPVVLNRVNHESPFVNNVDTDSMSSDDSRHMIAITHFSSQSNHV